MEADITVADTPVIVVAPEGELPALGVALLARCPGCGRTWGGLAASVFPGWQCCECGGRIEAVLEAKR
jgi:hypothetical protein